MTRHFAKDVSTVAASIVDLSTQAMRFRCITKKLRSGGISSRCTGPLAHLGRDGVFVEWSVVGDPGWRLSQEPGVSLTVAGRPARQQVLRPGAFCGSKGAAETIAVEITDSPDNYYSVMACLRGPDLRREARQVEAMISSTALASA